MKVNKKYIGWIIGLVCVVIAVVLLLTMCGSDPNEVIDETNQTEESTNQTESTESTEPSEESTGETTEPTEEPTEETTEPTEETTIPAAPPSTNNAIGSPGGFGTPDDEEEPTEPTEPEEVVIVPAGQDANPYAEMVRSYPAGFESVSVPGKGMVTYAVFVNDGAELTIESADAYVIHGGKTYDSVEGVVKLLLSAPKDGPAIFQLGNKAPGEKMFTLSFIDALGEPTNPLILEKIDEVKVELKEDDKTGYTMQWTAEEEGNVTFSVAEITENVKCDVILTVGEMSVHLVEPKQEDKEETEPSEPAKEKTEVTIGISKGDVLTIQVITLLPEKEAEKPAEGESTEPTDPSDPSEPTEPVGSVEEKLPAANIMLKGSFAAGENQDKQEQEETKPTEPEDTKPGDTTKPTEPGETTKPTEPGETTKPTEPGETTKPTEPGETTKPTEPGETTEPTEPSKPAEPTEPQGPAYSVTVTDYNGNPKANVAVLFQKDGTTVLMAAVDSKGVAGADLPDGNYTVMLMFSGEDLHYEEKDAVLTPSAPHITLQVAPAVSGTPESINDANAYPVTVGGTYTKLQADIVNYFIFVPTVAGNYQVTTSDPEAVVSYWGGNTFFLPSAPYEMDMKDNAYTLNVKEGNIGDGQGITHIIGVTGASDCILEITRLGDPILDETDFPITVYKEDVTIPAYTKVEAGKSKNYVDITAGSFTVVLNETDGFYHVGDANGPILYMDLGSTAPHVPLYGMMGMASIGGQNILQHFYDAEGKLIRRESYNYLLKQYATAADGNSYKVHPVTEDLKYMIQQAGTRKGWWDETSPDYMFADVSGLNPEIAWMFACCTLE